MVILSFAFYSSKTIACIPHQMVVKTQPNPSTFKFQYFHIPLSGHEARNSLEGNLNNPVFSCSLLSSECVTVD